MIMEHDFGSVIYWFKFKMELALVCKHTIEREKHSLTESVVLPLEQLSVSCLLDVSIFNPTAEQARN